MQQTIQINRNPKPFAGQEKAITVLDRSMLVSAGAGSGKTWVLTERYLEMLSKGYRPSQIVAITFTEKAAGEMKGRIRAAVQKMALQAEDPGEKRYWEQCEQELKQSLITTIHGFCARLLRANPVEAKLDPDFSVLDGMEGSLLIRDMFQEAVQWFLEQGGEEAQGLYQEFGQISAIVEAALTLFEKLRVYHKTTDDLWLETKEQVAVQEERFHAALRHLDECIYQLKDEFELIKGGAKKPAKYFGAFEDWMFRYDQLRARLESCGAALNDQDLLSIQDLLQNKWTKSGPDHFKELTDHLRLELLPAWVNSIVLPRYLPLVRTLLSVVEQAEKLYQQEKEQRMLVDFNDLESFAAALLKNNPHVCEKWQKRVEFLLVDEFQDTNSLQKLIIDCFTGQGKQMKLFVVGDGKQSIYRFRGADVQVFYQMEQEIVHEGGEKVSLAMNFRTQAGVIGYINSLFSVLMQRKEDDPLFYTVYEDLEAFRKLEKQEPQIEFIPAEQSGNDQRNAEPEGETSEEEEQHWVEKEADLIARRLKQMVEGQETLVWKKEASGEEMPVPARYGDMAILLAARSQMHVYEFTFQEYGIPYIVVGGRQFYQKQEVLDLINLLRLIQNPEDEVSLLGFLRSPFVQLSDESLFWLTRNSTLSRAFFKSEDKPGQMTAKDWQKLIKARHWVENWHQVSKWDGLYSLLQQVMDDTGFLLTLMAGPQGEQRIANVEKFLQLVSEWVDRKGYHLYDLVQFLSRMQEEQVQEQEASVVEDQRDAVVIMSVHASKGLEFPIVCIPELRKDVLKKGSSTTSVLYQPDLGVGVKLRELEKGMPGNGLYECLADEEKHRELQEAKRLLYVAMTRARDHLILVGSKPKGKTNWLQWIMEHLGWEEFEDSLTQSVIDQPNWKMKVWSGEEIPDFTKVSDITGKTNWQAWIEQGEKLDDRDLPDLPLMEDWQEDRVDEAAKAAHLPILSASALMLYEKCPRSFYLNYIEGLYGLDDFVQVGKKDDSNDGDGSLSSTEMGTLVHRLIECYPDGQVKDLVSVQEELFGSDRLMSEEDRHKVDVYMASYRQFMERCEPGPYEGEKTLFMMWQGQPIQGTLDRVQFLADGTIHIYDFKTNRLRGTLEEALEPYRLQGYLYVAMAEKVLIRPVSSMKFVFLQSGESIDLPLDQVEQAKYRNKVEQIVGQLKRQKNIDEYPPCSNLSCICHLF
ncbi:UvrD-helicase domain-containing protein [Ammoniphilus resinae]|uniref:DNA 3'-5' helicase n=1 Tax=Ammoniphilus resinae TaxID=861532 RepID=A0ABS4GTM2_9BACL|nr:UvrD-helicase domain-containing protein [Ammoniphilus resinae]MBP1933631.1 ATP-dependent helicase/nuclease subunit A [Ammoniphilus resinae]